MNATVFVWAKTESKTAARVAASGKPPDHRVALIRDAARPHLQDATLVARDGAAVGVPKFVLGAVFARGR